MIANAPREGALKGLEDVVVCASVAGKGLGFQGSLE